MSSTATFLAKINSLLEDAVDALLAKHGRAFKGECGWASQAIGKARPTYYDIAAAVNMNHWRPYFRMASHGVHAGPHGGYWDLGLPQGTKAIPASPSHFGLADPAAHSLAALTQVTVALLVHGLEQSMGQGDWPVSLRAQMELMVQLDALQGVADEAATMFVEIQKAGSEVTPRVVAGPHLWRGSKGGAV